MDSIPTRLRALRESKGITLRQLAERLGVGHSAIAKWETGVNDVGINPLRAWSEAFGMHFDVIAADHPLTSLQPDRLTPERSALLSTVIRDLDTLSEDEARMLRIQLDFLRSQRPG